MRALPILAETGYPVVFDATHSVQQRADRERSAAAGVRQGCNGERDFHREKRSNATHESRIDPKIRLC